MTGQLSGQSTQPSVKIPRSASCAVNSQLWLLESSFASQELELPFDEIRVLDGVVLKVIQFTHHSDFCLTDVTILSF